VGALEEIQEAVARVAERAGPAVVGVGARWGRGSGVVVAPDRVLTNAHNVAGERVTVFLQDGRTEEGSVAGIDSEGDLAVVTVTTGGISSLDWSTTAGLAIGTPVFALANPGGRGLRVSGGFVSGTDRAFRGPRGRRISGSIEHTAPLARGSSGGPLVDRDGRLVGINTNRLGEGFYLALPADEALRDRVDALARGESPRRARLGIGVAPSFVARRLRRSVGLPERDGVLVRVVEDEGPAARAGLERGDLIVEVNGRTVSRVDDLYDALESPDGGPLSLRVVRGAEEREVSVSPSEGGPPPERA
jgi:serine protease Do